MMKIERKMRSTTQKVRVQVMTDARTQGRAPPTVVTPRRVGREARAGIAQACRPSDHCDDWGGGIAAVLLMQHGVDEAWGGARQGGARARGRGASY